MAKEVVKTFVDTTLAQVQIAHQFETGFRIFIPRLRFGVPPALISKIAKREEVDLIIMGTQGERSLLEQAIGSVTAATLNRAPCPVLVIPEKANFEHIKAIAYATDLADADPYHIWEMGKLLAPFSAILRVVHIEQKTDEEKAMKMKDMEQFLLKKNAPALQITFSQYDRQRFGKPTGRVFRDLDDRSIDHVQASTRVI